MEFNSVQGKKKPRLVITFLQNGWAIELSAETRKEDPQQARDVPRRIKDGDGTEGS